MPSKIEFILLVIQNHFVTAVGARRIIFVSAELYLLHDDPGHVLSLLDPRRQNYKSLGSWRRQCSYKMWSVLNATGDATPSPPQNTLLLPRKYSPIKEAFKARSTFDFHWVCADGCPPGNLCTMPREAKVASIADISLSNIHHGGGQHMITGTKETVVILISTTGR